MNCKSKRLCAVVNPAAGSWQCMKKYKRARELLQSEGIDLNEKFSRYPGHIAQLIGEALSEESDIVIVVGGDGTMREALPALVYQDTEVFIFPFGTGNDMARFMGISGDPNKAVSQLLGGRARKVDAARANGSYYLNVAGLGFDVEVLLKTESLKRRFKNKAAYMLGIAAALVSLRDYSVTLETDSGERHFPSAMIVSVGNGGYIGGGMAALPKADISDGMLDVCVMHSVRKLRIPPVLLRFLNGRHLGMPETEYLKVSSLTLKTEKPMPVQLDGDIVEETPLALKILKASVNMILPREFAGPGGR